MTNEQQLKDYLLSKTELIAVRTSLQIKLDNAIRRNRDTPSEKLSELMEELNEMVKMLNRSITVLVAYESDLRQAYMANSKLKTQVAELVKERDELKKITNNMRL